MTTENKPVPPKPSSTVMVMRPVSEQKAEGGFELFMVRRHSKSRFMPDRYVFPGGRLEERDWQPASLSRLHGWEADGTESVFRDQKGRGAYDLAIGLSREQEGGLYVAAFRELFEEAGVLLAVEESGHAFDMGSDDRLPSHYAARRKLIHSGELDFVTMLEQEQLQLDMGQLIYYSHWITPITEPYRFDTRFFLAATPFNQVAESDYLETTDGVWVTPQTLLARTATSDFNIAFPTLLHIERLSHYPSMEATQDAARSKSVVTAMPQQFPDDENGPVFGLAADVVEGW